MTAFGLAAALAVPAQAGEASHEDDGVRFNSVLDDVVDGLLANTRIDRSSTSTSSSTTRPSRDHQHAPRDRYAEPRRGSAIGGGGFAAVAHLVQGSFGGAMGTLPPTRSAGLAGSSALSGAEGLTGSSPRGGAGSFMGGGPSVRGGAESLSRAVRKALPSADTNGRLAPLVGQLAPTEASPVLDSVPGTTQVASVDEIAPLVEDAAALTSTNGTKATNAYTDTVTAFGWTAAALTSAVQDPWHHR